MLAQQRVVRNQRETIKRTFGLRLLQGAVSADLAMLVVTRHQ